MRVYETKQFQQVASFIDQRPFRKVRFSKDNRYIISNNGFSKGTEYSIYRQDYDDMGSSIKAWELPQNYTNILVEKRVSNTYTITYNPIFAQMAVPYDDIDEYAEGVARIEKNKLFGYVDSVENIIIPIQYEEAANFKNGVAVVRKNGKYGVIDKKGKEILPIIYSNITSTPSYTFIVRKGEKVGLFDFTGKSLLPTTYGLLAYVVDDLYAFKEYDSTATNKKLQGIINEKGKIIQQAQYESMRNFANGFTIVWTPAKSSFGAMNRKGAISISTQYTDLQYFTNKNYPFVVAEQTVVLPNKKAVRLFGVIDSLGKIVLPISYEAIGDFDKGIAQITQKGKVGLIDSTMKIILNPDYQAIGKVKNNLLWIKQHNLYGFADLTGKIIISPQYAQVTDFEEGTAIVKQQRHWYRINTQNQKMIAKLKDYQNIEPFDNGVAKVRKNGLVGLIDQTGTETIVPIYNLIGEFRNGLALVQYDTKFGYINAKGEEVISTVYTEIQAFSEGMARFKRDTVSGYLNLQGVEVIKSAAFSKLQDFRNGMALLQKDDKYG
ncbi:MAG: WG repeat-containing protein, partial [Thermoflexibacteraceae bacterium]